MASVEAEAARQAGLAEAAAGAGQREQQLAEERDAVKAQLEQVGPNGQCHAARPCIQDEVVILCALLSRCLSLGARLEGQCHPIDVLL